jgi:hypothetical protein
MLGDILDSWSAVMSVDIKDSQVFCSECDIPMKYTRKLYKNMYRWTCERCDLECDIIIK